VLIKVALDNILQTNFAKIKRNCHKHTRTFTFVAVKYGVVKERKEIVKLHFSYLYSKSIKMCGVSNWTNSKRKLPVVHHLNYLS
jgi:hypothetical protein